jgi:hypothetical protein
MICFSKFHDIILSQEGIQFATSGTHPSPAVSYALYNLFVGFTDNKGNNVNIPLQKWNQGLDATTPETNNPRHGWFTYDGPHIFVGNTFRNYKGNHAAIGARWRNMVTKSKAIYILICSLKGQMAVTTSIERSFFTGRVDKKYFIADEEEDGGDYANVRDINGSISGYDGWVLSNRKFYKTKYCQESDVFGIACPQKYAQIYIENHQYSSGTYHHGLIRNDHENDYPSMYTEKKYILISPTSVKTILQKIGK